MIWCVGDRKRQSGQVLPIAAAAFVVMSALAGLAVDASRDYLVKRNAQNAADLSVIAAAKQMTIFGNLNAPVASGSSTLVAAHDFAASNGFSTLYSTGCDSTRPSSSASTRPSRWRGPCCPAPGAPTTVRPSGSGRAPRRRSTAMTGLY